jgi:hypothetical protein
MPGVTETKGLHCGLCGYKVKIRTGVDKEGNDAYHCTKFNLHVRRDYDIDIKSYLRCKQCRKS